MVYHLRRNQISGLDGWTPFYPPTDKVFYDTYIEEEATYERGYNYTNNLLAEAEIYNDNT